MKKRELSKDEIKRGYFNNKSIEEIGEWFDRQNYHAINGIQIDSIEDWNKMVVFDASGADMYCYQESEEGEPYVFNDEEFPAIYQDGFILNVAELTIDGKSTGCYALMDGNEIVYG